MTEWDMTKKQVTPDGKVIATGEKITPLYDDTNTKDVPPILNS